MSGIKNKSIFRLGFMDNQYNKISDDSQLSVSANKLIKALRTLDAIWGIEIQKNQGLLQNRYKLYKHRYKLYKRKKLIVRAKLLRKRRIKQQRLQHKLQIEQQQIVQKLLEAQFVNKLSLQKEQNYRTIRSNKLYFGS